MEIFFLGSWTQERCAGMLEVIKMKVFCYQEFVVTLAFKAKLKAKVEDAFLPVSTL